MISVYNITLGQDFQEVPMSPSAKSLTESFTNGLERDTSTGIARHSTHAFTQLSQGVFVRKLQLRSEANPALFTV